MKVSFIGGGVMAEAIISGMNGAAIDVGITVSEPIAERASYLDQTYGVEIAKNNVDAVSNADLAVLAVKPQQLVDVADEIRDVVPSLDRITFMSIMAGVKTKTIVDQIGCDRVIRIMANTPSQVGLGATAWTASQSVSAEMREFAKEMLESFGEQVYFDDEKLVDIATALSASGPAYVFVFIEALIDGAVQLGMTNSDARELAIQMVLGSAALAKETGKHPARTPQPSYLTGRHHRGRVARVRGCRIPKRIYRRGPCRVPARRGIGSGVVRRQNDRNSIIPAEIYLGV